MRDKTSSGAACEPQARAPLRQTASGLGFGLDDTAKQSCRGGIRTEIFGNATASHGSMEKLISFFRVRSEHNRWSVRLPVPRSARHGEGGSCGPSWR